MGRCIRPGLGFCGECVGGTGDKEIENIDEKIAGALNCGKWATARCLSTFLCFYNCVPNFLLCEWSCDKSAIYLS